jgi:hypothetical protein
MNTSEMLEKLTALMKEYEDGTGYPAGCIFEAWAIAERGDLHEWNGKEFVKLSHKIQLQKVVL